MTMFLSLITKTSPKKRSRPHGNARAVAAHAVEAEPRRRSAGSDRASPLAGRSVFRSALRGCQWGTESNEITVRVLNKELRRRYTLDRQGDPNTG